MTERKTIEPRQGRAPRTSKGADPPARHEHFTIDRETLDHLPSELERMIAEIRIRDGSWTLINSEKKEVAV